MSFAAMPAVPMTGLDSFIASYMYAVKQNVEMLTGQYGDQSFRAVLSGFITVQPATGTLLQITAKGAGWDIAGGTGTVPTLADYFELLKSTQLLANDVEVLRQTVNALIAQLRA